MFERNIQAELKAALADTPVVLLNGARQTGKSTLAGNFAKQASIPYVTLDDATKLAAARSDAQGFLSGLSAITGLVGEPGQTANQITEDTSY